MMSRKVIVDRLWEDTEFRIEEDEDEEEEANDEEVLREDLDLIIVRISDEIALVVPNEHTRRIKRFGIAMSRFNV